MKDITGRGIVPVYMSIRVVQTVHLQPSAALFLFFSSCLFLFRTSRPQHLDSRAAIRVFPRKNSSQRIFLSCCAVSAVNCVLQTNRAMVAVSHFPGSSTGWRPHRLPFTSNAYHPTVLFFPHQSEIRMLGRTPLDISDLFFPHQ